MVAFRRLEPAEVASAFPKRGQMDLTEYSDALQDLNPGDAMEVSLDGLTTRAMKRRLGMAANTRGLALKFSRQEDPGTLYFQVRAQNTRPANPNDGRRRRRVGRPSLTAVPEPTVIDNSTRAPNVIDGSSTKSKRTRKKVAS